MPKLINAVLVQSQSDWFWVEDDTSIGLFDRSEGSLSLNGIDDNAECTRIAQQYLQSTAYPQLSMNAQVEPLGGDLPYRDYNNDDTITASNASGTPEAAIVAEIDYTTDAEGWAIPVPVLHNVKQDAWLKFQAWLQANQNGLGGQASRASALQPEFSTVVNGKVPVEGPYTFSFSGLVATGKATPPTSPSMDVRVTQVVVKAPAADTTGHAGYVGTGSSSVFAVYRRLRGTSGTPTLVGISGGNWPDPSHPGWVALTPSTFEIDVYVGNEFISKQEELWAVCLSGGGHTDVSVEVTAAPVL